jgi:3-(3-hydroxy-phenyl)propionate hydroxylase
MAPASKWGLMKRNAVLRGSVRLPRLRRLVNSGRLAEPFTYLDSPIVERRDAALGDKLRPGAPPPDAACTVGGSSVRFRELLGKGFITLYFPVDTGRSVDLARRADADLPNVNYLVVPTEDASTRPLPADAHWLVDRAGTLAATLRVGRDEAEVLRPDGHLAVRLGEPNADSLAWALELASGRLLRTANSHVPIATSPVAG